MSTRATPVPPPAARVTVSTFGKPMFFSPDSPEWRELKPDIAPGIDTAEEHQILDAAKACFQNENGAGVSGEIFGKSEE